MINLSDEEIEAIYRCISFAMDLRDSLEWDNEENYWTQWDWLSKNIRIALMATHKLSNFQNELYKSQKKRLEALQRLSDLDQELGLV